ncbi:hypothetical protein GCM10011494_28400 [Novosphingobium endophyticum]|uniref:Uncharacterized protein n=1 Tax=Novosphingobium endophyticum TaxID=1955250 RepID=A0A916TTU3_9SPHN|nr:hypothetical protein [Novosphingobium endophyticum]GGC08076.1 hypothetical protein GCM10011494_28400 [Novosphingobium endophyticum]
MSEPRDFASLSPRLLARKGGAKPAMRPQDTSKFTAGGIPIDPHRADDLGWNDFGDGLRPEAAASVPQTAANGNGHGGYEIPEVLRQIEQVATRIDRDHPAARVRSEGRRAAFTLRLDAERHFRLKMAGVLLDRSAQVIVTEALDRFLAEMPELSVLAGTARKPS